MIECGRRARFLLESRQPVDRTPDGGAPVAVSF